MSNDEKDVLEYLEKNAQGERNKKTSEEIRKALELPSVGGTNDYIREIIRNLIKNHNAIIGSDSRGYWIIQNEKELRNVIKSLKTRSEEISKRAEALQNNWEKRNNE